MNIIVCIKQVPDVTEVSWEPETGSLIRKGIPSIINPNDKTAIEAALQLKERYGGVVTPISMGPSQVEEALREALGLGVDNAIQLTAKEFAGSDTWATAYTIGLAVKKIGVYDLIICGKESVDGMTAQVGPQLAEVLNLTQLTYALDIVVVGCKVIVEQHLGDSNRLIESPMPALITVERKAYESRVAPMDCILEAYNKEIAVWGPNDLRGDVEYLGLKGSPTKLKKIFSPKVLKGMVEMIEGADKEIAHKLVSHLKAKLII